MSKLVHAILHGLAVLAQYGLAVVDFIPGKWKPLFAGLLAIAQAVLGLVNHTPPAR